MSERTKEIPFRLTLTPVHTRIHHSSPINSMCRRSQRTGKPACTCVCALACSRVHNKRCSDVIDFRRARRRFKTPPSHHLATVQYRGCVRVAIDPLAFIAPSTHTHTWRHPPASTGRAQRPLKSIFNIVPALQHFQPSNNTHPHIHRRSYVSGRCLWRPTGARSHVNPTHLWRMHGHTVVHHLITWPPARLIGRDDVERGLAFWLLVMLMRWAGAAVFVCSFHTTAMLCNCFRVRSAVWLIGYCTRVCLFCWRVCVSVHCRTRARGDRGGKCTYI